MEPFLIVLVVIFIIILITLIGVVIFLIVNNSGTPPASGCVNDEGCSSGFICQAGVCKAGIGTACTQDTDCGTGLRCDSGTRVCVPNTVTSTPNPSPISSIHPRKQDFPTVKPRLMPQLKSQPSIVTSPSIQLPIEPSPEPMEVSPVSELSSVSELPINFPIELPPPIKLSLTQLYWTDPSQMELPVAEPTLPLHQLTSRTQHTLLPISNTPLSPISSPSLIPNPAARNPTTRTVVRPHRLGQSTTPLSDLDNDSAEEPGGTIIASLPVSTRFNRRPIESSPSSDDEINSAGDYTDRPFDIRSGPSTLDSDKGSSGPRRGSDTDSDTALITQVSTPCQQKDGIYYCRNQADQIEELQSEAVLSSSPVIDVCSYSNLTLFLLADGHIIAEKESGQRVRITNNRRLIQIRAFNGYIYGVDSEGHLNLLPNNYLSSSNWHWTLAGWAPSPIGSISTTHDGAYLWLQTDFNRAYLYDRPYHCILELEHYNYHRIYGRDLEHYLEIDSQTATAILHPDKRTITNICDGALSYYDEVVAIHPADREIYRRVAIINWRPYYIRY